MAAYDNQGYLVPGFDIEYPSPLYSASTASELTLVGDQQFSPSSYHVSDISPRPAKKQRIATLITSVKKESKKNTQMTAEAAGGGDAVEGAASKPKRVRTGCLTCRERYELLTPLVCRSNRLQTFEVR